MEKIEIGSGASFGRVTVLLVDDNPGDRRLVIEFLKMVEDGNYRVIEVDTLAKACACLPGCAADVVLLDLSLPDGAGPQNVTALRELAADVPIVVLSGSEDERIIAAVADAGAAAFLSKMDMTDAQLAATLNKVLSGRRRGGR